MLVIKGMVITPFIRDFGMSQIKSPVFFPFQDIINISNFTIYNKLSSQLLISLKLAHSLERCKSQSGLLICNGAIIYFNENQ